MKNVFILGSCVSRDSLAAAVDGDFYLVDYFARSSFASAFALPAAPVGSWIDNIQSPFQRNMVKRDFEKSLFSSFAKLVEDVDVFLLDVIDERFDIYKFLDGSLCTLSNELLTSGFTLGGGDRIPSMSDEFYAYWEKGWKRFIQELRTCGGLHKLWINKVYWAQETHAGKNFEPHFSADRIRRANDFLQKLYIRMERDVPEIQFAQFNLALFAGDDFHKWGLSPFHYVPEYYREVCNCLNTFSTVQPTHAACSVPKVQAVPNEEFPVHTRRMIITVDVEALLGRAKTKHIDRLIWGKVTSENTLNCHSATETEYGIGKMMSIADKAGIKLSFFLDYAARERYGEDLLDVGREILRRGHDLQLHLHPEAFSPSFFSSRSVSFQRDMRLCTKEQCKCLLDYVLEAHSLVTAIAPVAYRSGAFYINLPLLEVLAERNIPISSNYLACYPDRSPLKLGLQKYFRWPSGVFELPVPCVENFPGSTYRVYLPEHISNKLGFVSSQCMPYNFNDEALLHGSIHDCATRHRDYLDAFYSACGDDSVAVMMMHSWSFFQRDERGYQNILDEEAASKFEALLAELAKDTRVLTMQDFAAELPNAPELSALTYAGVPVVQVENTDKINGGVKNKVKNNDVQTVVCPICGTPHAAFVDFNNGPKRQCPTCLSLERQRTFYDLYVAGAFGERCLEGKKILHVSPSGPETQILSHISGTEVVTIDIRPQMGTDIIGDITQMPEVSTGTFDVVFCSYVLCLLSPQKVRIAIAELSRVLKPGGLLLCYDHVTNIPITRYEKDIEVITQCYGVGNYKNYGFGEHIFFSTHDYEKYFSKHFSTVLCSDNDKATNTVSYWMKGINKNAGENFSEFNIHNKQSISKFYPGRYTMHNLPIGFGDKEFLEKQNQQHASRIEKIQLLLENSSSIRDDYDFFCKLHEVMLDENRTFPQYDPQQRVKDSMGLLCTLRDSFGKFDSYLDIGCGMGYAPRAAFEMGCAASVGIDITESPQWTKYCQDSGEKLRFLCGDITQMDFDRKFDLVTSYYAFEHFDDPLNILDNIAKFLSDKGTFYTRFGPIFYGANGSHRYREISIPWFQHIFSEDVIRQFLGIPHNNNMYIGLNKWSGFDFLHLFANAGSLKVKKMDFMWDMSNYWFANIFHEHLPYSPQDLYLHGLIVAFEKSTVQRPSFGAKIRKIFSKF